MTWLRATMSRRSPSVLKPCSTTWSSSSSTSLSRGDRARAGSAAPGRPRSARRPPAAGSARAAPSPCASRRPAAGGRGERGRLRGRVRDSRRRVALRRCLSRSTSLLRQRALDRPAEGGRAPTRPGRRRTTRARDRRRPFAGRRASGLDRPDAARRGGSRLGRTWRQTLASASLRPRAGCSRSTSSASSARAALRAPRWCPGWATAAAPMRRTAAGRRCRRPAPWSARATRRGSRPPRPPGRRPLLGAVPRPGLGIGTADGGRLGGALPAGCGPAPRRHRRPRPTAQFDPRPIRQAGEVARQQGRDELPQLQVEGGELDVGGQVVARRHQEVFLPQHGAHGVELGRPDVLDAVPHACRRQLSLGQPRVEGGVDAGVEQQAPVADQRLVARPRGQLVGLRPHQQHDRLGQVALRGDAQLVAGGQPEQGVAGDDVGLDVRHAQAEADEAAVGLDDPAQEFATGPGRPPGRRRAVLCSSRAASMGGEAVGIMGRPSRRFRYPVILLSYRAARSSAPNPPNPGPRAAHHLH